MTNYWGFLFDQKKGILWCEVTYPDWGGTSAPCNELIEVEEPLFSFTDSLDKYCELDSVLSIDNFWIYATNLNELNVGLIEIADTMTLLFQKINDSWVITDTLYLPLLFFEKTDINGDGFDDLVVTHFITGRGGNRENISLLYSPVLQKAMRNRDFDLPNIKYDSKKKLVYSAWWSGASGPQRKMAFKINGDSLIKIREVVFEPDGIVSFYNFKKHKQPLAKEAKYSPEKAYDIFSKAIWDSSDE